MVFYYTYYSDDFLEALTVSSAIFGFRGGNQSVLPGERLVKKGGKVTDNFDWSDSTSREVLKQAFFFTDFAVSRITEFPKP